MFLISLIANIAVMINFLMIYSSLYYQSPVDAHFLYPQRNRYFHIQFVIITKFQSIKLSMIEEQSQFDILYSGNTIIIGH